MIAHLAGTLLHKQPNVVVIDVGGVGYEVNIPVSTFYELADVGEPITLRIHTYVREDALQLYGFRTAREKEVFLKLTSISGIGPKLAVTILSGVAVEELVPAIQRNDLARLTAIPGVGKKTAERIVVELRDRIGSIAATPADAGPPATSAVGAASDSIRDDVIAALITLGYQRAQAEKAVARVLAERQGQSLEDLLRQSLRQLSR
jgi:Holliday junction DNA helicase RuvA